MVYILIMNNREYRDNQQLNGTGDTLSPRYSPRPPVVQKENTMTLKQKAMKMANDRNVEVVGAYDNSGIVEIELIAPDGYWWESDARTTAVISDEFLTANELWEIVIRELMIPLSPIPPHRSL